MLYNQMFVIRGGVLGLKGGVSLGTPLGFNKMESNFGALEKPRWVTGWVAPCCGVYYFFREGTSWF